MLSVQSLNSVLQYLDHLERHGLITRQRYQHRSIVLTTAELGASQGSVVLPVIASAGCDAMNMFAQQAFDEYFAVDQNHIPLGKSIQTLVMFRAIDSMNAAGIADGDCVLVERTDAVNSGDRVVAAIDGMAVIKRLRRTADDTLILEPESTDPSYERIIMLDNSRIFGKVLNVIKREAEDDEYVIEYANGKREVY